MEGVREMDGETKVEPLTARSTGLEDYREVLAQVVSAQLARS